MQRHVAPFLGLASMALASSLGVAACKGHASKTDTTSSEEAGTEVAIEARPRADGGPDAGPGYPQLTALESPAPVFSDTEFPPKNPDKAEEARKGVIRLGYLRKGAVVDVKPKIIKKGNCAEGWYELVGGGFICGKFGTIEPEKFAKELETAPHAPFSDQPLPYVYGMVLTNGTPLYRRFPLRKERKEKEAGLPVGRGAKPDPNAAKTNDGATPWYLMEHNGQKPSVSFDDLRAEGGLVVLRMVRGFYLSLDKEVHAFAGKFWRTTDGYYVPSEFILAHKSVTDFEGVKLGPNEKRHLPIGWMLGIHGRKYFVDENAEKKVRRGDHVDRFTAVQLTGKKAVVDDKNYYETDEGWWLRGVDGTLTTPGEPPKDLKPGEKWIDIDLSTQTLVAFEGDKPVFATIVSTGRRNKEDPSKDHKTVTGEFAIREKHVSATMDDDGAGDGTYSIQDVPWIMYFKGSYALHGAFWHSGFGHERSHGCVNLQPIDARTIFDWVGPTLPSGWHGLRATDANPGTRVIVHD